MPSYDESVRITTWPGTIRHLLFPRFYRILDKQGNALIDASSLWALMDRDTRKAAFPDRHGICVPGVTTGTEIPLPSVPKGTPVAFLGTFTVPYSYIDQNGHMNNTRYFDLAEDRMPAKLRERTLYRVQTEYSREARLDTEITLKSEQSDDTFLLVGENEGQKLFKLAFTYASENK